MRAGGDKLGENPSKEMVQEIIEKAKEMAAKDGYEF